MGGMSRDTDASGGPDDGRQSTERNLGDWQSQRSLATDQLLLLTRTIEAEIIPRLLLANSAAQCQPDPGPELVFTNIVPAHEHVEELANLVVRHDITTSQAYIENLRARGTSLDDVFLKLLAPTARHLGELWDADLQNFTDVTIGLTTLQHLLRTLSPGYDDFVDQVPPGHRILLVPARGETHTFGLRMLEEFFRRAGWDVDISTSADKPGFTALIASENISVVGFSLSLESGLDQLAADIRNMRRKSKNPDVGIMVGGPAFLDHPERVKQVGADGTAADGLMAVAAANRFVMEKSGRQR
jgi:MerR family transcriptional regulator, light-induced transcriptional regulator